MIQLISTQVEIQPYASLKLFRIMGTENATNAQPLLQIAFWCVGEYGDLLIANTDETQTKVVQLILCIV
jgi:AP-1 complex subunit gamma-1